MFGPVARSGDRWRPSRTSPTSRTGAQHHVPGSSHLPTGGLPSCAASLVAARRFLVALVSTVSVAARCFLMPPSVHPKGARRGAEHSLRQPFPFEPKSSRLHGGEHVLGRAPSAGARRGPGECLRRTVTRQLEQRRLAPGAGAVLPAARDQFLGLADASLEEDDHRVQMRRTFGN